MTTTTRPRLKVRYDEQLRAQLKEGRLVIIGDYQADHKPERLLKRLRQLTDQLLTRGWKSFAK